MPRLLSVLPAIAVLCSGCNTVPYLNTPDGSSRIPINRSDAIAEYSRGLERDQAAGRDLVAANQQLELLQRDITDLRASMAASARQHEEPVPASTIPANSVAPSIVVQRSAFLTKGMLKPAEIIRADDQVVMFRSFFTDGDSKFSPSPFFQQALIKAAMEGHAIAIWGATDARVKTPASEAIARQRAEAARNFLVAKGVDSTKMKTHFLAAGGFVADNSGPEGRMKNRRVDIEVTKSVDARTPGNNSPKEEAQQ